MLFARPSLMLIALAALVTQNTLIGVERTAPRTLYDFEQGAELEELRAKAENVVLDLVQDNGVTRGRNCCRMVFKQGGGDAVLQITGARAKDWSGYAAVVFDIYQERTEKWPMHVELWDQASTNYHTRCTYDPVVRPGRNTVVVAIDRAKRNGKEGRDWSELEPQDKIDLDALKMVKIFLSCPTAGGDLVWWVDNIRLLTSDAVNGPPLKVDLPPGAKAFALGRATSEVTGFTPVPADAVFSSATGFGNESGSPQAMGKGWPDVLTGRGLLDPAGGTTRFAIALPDGDYRVWLAGGMAIDAEAPDASYALRIGDHVLYEDKPTPEQVRSEKYLYRFLGTHYSERDHALWLDYIDRMYPTYEQRVTVRGGKLVISATRFWLSAVVVMPARDEAAFKTMTAQIRTQRMQAFAKTLTPDPQRKPQRIPGDGPGVAFIPDVTTSFRPDTGPTEAERKRTSYDLAAAPGQRLVLRLGLTAFEALGECRFALSPLTGPTTIPASAARLYVMDYRVRGDGVQESALKPVDRITAERGITWCFHAWLGVPDDAPPGDYAGTVTLTPGVGKALSFPLKLTVHPFRLRADLPLSLGMYYDVPVDERTHLEQLRFMREIGFTATAVPAGNISGVTGERVRVGFNEPVYRRVKTAGFGRHPQQLQMSNSLGAARRIAAAHLGFGPRVDQRPGCEMEDPRLKPLYQDYLRQYAEFVKTTNLPVAIEIVDEPREVPNPWNRNLADTNRYADWMREAGITTGFVTPMGDVGGGKDYSSIADHASIVSTHAGKGSERLMRKTLAAGKPLWIYNVGMDRLSWGFYLGRIGAVGHWEWHFNWYEPGSTQGYPNSGEWFNPFTTCDGFAPRASASYPGSMLFKSAYFTVAEGIADAAYLTTLTDALQKAARDPRKAEAVTAARAFIAELERAIPFLPDVHGLASEADGALVGQGLHTPAGERCEEWRRRVAQLIIALGR